ncbi:glycosyltransferase family 2 protein, partial [Microgenomates group bacterium]|nr:glycosyltransferase family 2 protein [Microgenomates group bacterium]
KLKKEVIVIDNGSQDGSVEYLKKKFPQYSVYSSGGNLGFAQGNNFGVNKAIGKYIWLLNSDTLIKPSTISTLMKLAVKNNSPIASCQLLNSDGSIQPQGGYLPDLWRLALWMLFIDDLPVIKSLVKPYHQNLKSFFQSDQHPGWLGGTALLIRCDIYKKLNGLDKNIFMYGEDVEFCLRAKQQGIRIDYFAQPKLIHLGQASGSSRRAILGEYQGLIYIYKKYFNYYQQLALKILLKLGAILRVIIFRNKIYAEAFQLA